MRKTLALILALLLLPVAAHADIVNPPAASGGSLPCFLFSSSTQQNCFAQWVNVVTVASSTCGPFTTTTCATVTLTKAYTSGAFNASTFSCGSPFESAISKTADTYNFSRVPSSPAGTPPGGNGDAYQVAWNTNNTLYVIAISPGGTQVIDASVTKGGFWCFGY